MPYTLGPAPSSTLLSLVCFTSFCLFRPLCYMFFFWLLFRQDMFYGRFLLQMVWLHSFIVLTWHLSPLIWLCCPKVPHLCIEFVEVHFPSRFLQNLDMLWQFPRFQLMGISSPVFAASLLSHPHVFREQYLFTTLRFSLGSPRDTALCYKPNLCTLSVYPPLEVCFASL